jgi:hypothetical protein
MHVEAHECEPRASVAPVAVTWKDDLGVARHPRGSEHGEN